MLATRKPIKKVIILDAGGVLQPNAEFDLPNQKGITLFPGVPEMIRELYKAGYQVAICTTNSDLGVAHTRWLLGEQDLYCPVYGSAELHLLKNNPEIYLQICKTEQVSPEECWFIDDCEKNLDAARSLGISVIKFNRPMTLNDTAKEVNACRDQLLTAGILSVRNFEFPSHFNRGKYPSLFGIVNNKVVRYQPSDRRYAEVDEPNEDGNQRKRCLYESRLAKLIIERGRQYWCSGYHAINQLFLADFDLKSDSKRVNDYKAYFDKIGASLKKEGLIEDKSSYDMQELRSVLVKLFVDNFDLTHVSQFYYNVWLCNYGPEPLEPFVFLTDLLKEKRQISNDFSWQAAQQMRLLQLFPNMANNVEDRRQAYYIAQPWLTCGPPQLRGRQPRFNAPKPADAKTLGIIRDDDPYAIDFSSRPHFAAKAFFSPSRNHPIAKEFQSNAAPVIGGSSGTLGRNILMLSPLVQTGLLSEAQLKNYVMGFLADLINRGHHSYEEVAVVAEQILSPLKPWLDSLRDPTGFYEQLLTDEFLVSTVYRQFLTEHDGFFNAPVAQMKMT